MTSLWDCVRRLEGTDLPTAGGISSFTIVEVSDHALVLIPAGGKRSKRTIRLSQMSEAQRMGLVRRDVTRKEVEASGVTTKHLSYLTAILRHVAQTLVYGTAD